MLWFILQIILSRKIVTANKVFERVGYDIIFTLIQRYEKWFSLEEICALYTCTNRYESEL